MAAATAILNKLPAPYTNGVGEVYQQLKNILGTTTVQQVESSIQHHVEASILTPVCPKDRGQTATQGALVVRMASLLMRISAHDRMSRPGGQSEPQVRRWHRTGDDDA
jgi:hypothetical protein